MPAKITSRITRHVYRLFFGGAVLLVPVVAFLFLASDVFALSGTRDLAPSSVLDLRAFSPFTQYKPIVSPKPVTEDELPPVQLGVWDNTGGPRSGLN
jgi:hypothetical protein